MPSSFENALKGLDEKLDENEWLVVEKIAGLLQRAAERAREEQGAEIPQSPRDMDAATATRVVQDFLRRHGGPPGYPERGYYDPQRGWVIIVKLSCYLCHLAHRICFTVDAATGEITGYTPFEQSIPKGQ